MPAPHSSLEDKGLPCGMDAELVDEYTAQSKLLLELSDLPSVDKAWLIPSEAGSPDMSRALFLVGQSNLLANRRRKSVLSAHVSKPAGGDKSPKFLWSPFPSELATDVATIVPSPSGAKLLVVRNPLETSSSATTKLEIWGPAGVTVVISVPESVHGAVYADGWFEGISWSSDEESVAYIAEEPPRMQPTFGPSGFQASPEKDSSSSGATWKGEGEWEEHWGETYATKRRPALFVLSVARKEVRAVEGIEQSVSIGQVVWEPAAGKGGGKRMVFVGWTEENGFGGAARKLGIKYCYNRPCALYVAFNPFEIDGVAVPAASIKVTPEETTSAFSPQFTPDGQYLVFLSASTAVETGAHCTALSLHRMLWSAEGTADLVHTSTYETVVSVVACPRDDGFPGIYMPNMPSDPWLTDGRTMIVSSVWRSTTVILSLNISSNEVTRISLDNADHSWSVLSVDGDDILAVCSGPLDPPRIKYGSKSSGGWVWSDISSPFSASFEKVRSLLSEHSSRILQIPVNDPSDDLAEGAKLPFEAIFVSCRDSASRPTVVYLHGGPHSVLVSSYMKSWAFLSLLGFNLLVVNYRGSLGFGEDALQSLPGKIGSQDVRDVLTAIDYAIAEGLVDASQLAVIGGSHGGFLTTHLIGQVPDRFLAACARNPVCNLSIMVGTTDIPDWCYVEACGHGSLKSIASEAPTADDLSLFYQKSPISHVSKVKTPILILLGARDLRVPVSNGMQYARVLKERGADVKVIVFQDDVHGLEKPQCDFESFVNIGVWFKKHLSK